MGARCGGVEIVCLVKKPDAWRSTYSGHYSRGAEKALRLCPISMRIDGKRVEDQGSPAPHTRIQADVPTLPHHPTRMGPRCSSSFSGPDFLYQPLLPSRSSVGAVFPICKSSRVARQRGPDAEPLFFISRTRHFVFVRRPNLRLAQIWRHRSRAPPPAQRYLFLILSTPPLSMELVFTTSKLGERFD